LARPLYNPSVTKPLRGGNREQGTGNREQGTGNREQGTGNREQGTEKKELAPNIGFRASKFIYEKR
jgi:hypothetical protein